MSVWNRSAGLGIVTFALAGLVACGVTSDGDDCPGEETARLHVVNTTDTPGFDVTATYAGHVCMKDLPVSDEGGLELAQLVIEAGPGDVVQVRADGAGSTTVNCQVSENAMRSGGTSGNYQLFVNFAAAPTLSLTCADGFNTPE